MADAVCPKCGAAAVELDVVLGVSACEACGAVLSEEELVHAAPFDVGGAGTWVGGADTGEAAGAYALAATGAGLAIQRSRQGSGASKTKARVREFAALLSLQPAVTDQGVHLASQALPLIKPGSWRRDHLAAAAAYAACRLNALPLTLADLSAATQLDLFTLGVRYTTLCRLLGLQPPLLTAASLLPRSVDRVTAEAARQGTLSGPQVAAVQRDAGMLVDWMQRQLERKPYPMAAVGAAVVLAAEMNTVSLSLAHVSASLPVGRRTLEAKLTQVRQRLVALSGYLPYKASITTRNVGSHARTIIQLSALVGTTTDADSSPGASGSPQGSGSGGGGSGSGRAIVAMPQAQPQAQQQQAQQQPTQQQQQQQPLEAPSAGSGGGGALAGRQSKRQRTDAPSSSTGAVAAARQQQPEPQAQRGASLEAAG